MNQQNRGVFIGGVVILVIAALLLWWIAARRPLSIFSGMTQSTSTTQQTATSTASKDTKPSGTKGIISKTTRSTQTVTQIVNSVASAQFKSLFQSTGVAASISSSGKYTIFVPTSGAFAQLPSGTISEMTSAEKKRLVQYHVVSGRAVDVDAEVAGTIQALSGDALNFSHGTDKIPMVNSAIIVAEYTGKNGTVYLIDNVLLPPKKTNI
ncbi:MAG: fasciclin domain-containing protein [Candidatus Kaiserbacteria bacterium]|nr:fasciclin domain-containing protein [Candidatus Kaiserbacteria bacterium]